VSNCLFRKEKDRHPIPLRKIKSVDGPVIHFLYLLLRSAFQNQVLLVRRLYTRVVNSARSPPYWSVLTCLADIFAGQRQTPYGRGCSGFNRLALHLWGSLEIGEVTITEKSETSRMCTSRQEKFTVEASTSPL
jgi:hypothetical protein